jgi:serine/threonine protein kinase
MNSNPSIPEHTGGNQDALAQNTDAEYIGKFYNESQFIAGLKHDNIVRVYDVAHLYRTVFIIMENLQRLPLDYMLHSMPRLRIEKAVFSNKLCCNRAALRCSREGIV